MVELVSQGHPDKVADAISDVVVREYLKANKDNKVACETLISNGKIFLCGEVTGEVDTNVLHSAIINKVREIGYTEDYEIHDNLVKQSKELTEITNNGLANDQCVVYGYACTGADYMPIEYVIAYTTLNALKFIPGLRPDAKVLVDSETKTIKISTSHEEYISLIELREIVEKRLKKSGGIFSLYNILVNPAGTFVKCGPDADCGVTGRKIVVDAYGTGIPVGGGAFSGKDFSKLDRSAAYMSRIIAIDILRSLGGTMKDLRNVTVETSYMIGDVTPKVIAKIFDTTEGYQVLDVSKKYARILKPDYLKNFFNEHIDDITNYTWCPFMKLFGECEVSAVNARIFENNKEQTHITNE